MGVVGAWLRYCNWKLWDGILSGGLDMRQTTFVVWGIGGRTSLHEHLSPGFYGGTLEPPVSVSRPGVECEHGPALLHPGAHPEAQRAEARRVERKGQFDGDPLQILACHVILLAAPLSVYEFFFFGRRGVEGRFPLREAILPQTVFFQTLPESQSRLILSVNKSRPSTESGQAFAMARSAKSLLSAST